LLGFGFIVFYFETMPTSRQTRLRSDKYAGNITKRGKVSTASSAEVRPSMMLYLLLSSLISIKFFVRKEKTTIKYHQFLLGSYFLSWLGGKVFVSNKLLFF
jgi:hypothetical protein